ncbi:MAG: hypothetical protein AAF282_02180 [Cyanobacteria bacterium P01_A01_bin.15]
MDYLAPFETWEVDHPDFNRADALAETQRQQHREAAIWGYIFGDTPLDYVLDLMAEHTGIGADHYIDMVEDNVNHVINGRRYVEAPSGLLLPG